MRVLVCGGRNFDDQARLVSVLDELHQLQPIGTIISVMARGADTLAWQWANDRNIPRAEYLADWNRHGRSAGFRRNEVMLRDGKPDVVVAFPGGTGTGHMIAIATDAGITTIEADALP